MVVVLCEEGDYPGLELVFIEIVLYASSSVVSVRSGMDLPMLPTFSSRMHDCTMYVPRSGRCSCISFLQRTILSSPRTSTSTRTAISRRNFLKISLAQHEH